MEKFYISYEVNDDKLAQMIELDKKAYFYNDVGNFNLCKDWLSKNSEITVMRSCGFPFLRIISSVIILSFFVMGLAFFVGSDLLPYTANKLKVIKGEVRSSQFVFPVKKADGAMDKILVVSNFDDNNIRDVIVLNFYNDYEKGSSLLSSIIMSALQATASFT